MLFHKAYVDIMHMLTAGGFSYIIQVRRSLTSYPEYKLLRSESAVAITAFIFKYIICRWGILLAIVSDNGAAMLKGIQLAIKKY